ncbi:hypothetical protein [Frankia gtarii]|uniref:hypothetical protein n=1 Tax=Frankia gtarii TaxID=2950102 RepID=UPI0021BE95D0|nr:hypothetical protein [Frankia gtarii]
MTAAAVDGALFTDPEPTRCRYSPHPAAEDLVSGSGARRAHPASRIREEREYRRVGQRELDVRVPSRVEVRERVVAVLGAGSPGDARGEHVLGDGIEQAVLVAEDAVDRRRLHISLGGDRSRGDRLRAAGA